MRKAIVLALTLVAALAAYAAAPPRLVRAIAAQRELAARLPQDVEVANDLGNLLVLAGELAEAEQIYLRALALDPDNASTHYNLALLYQQEQKGYRALRHLRQVLERHPDHAWAHYQVGTLYQRWGMESRAVDEYARAFALDPTLAFAEVNPHLVDNDLLTRALLEAHRAAPSGALAPRIYEQPSRIADLLLPPPPPAAPDELADQEPEETDERAAALPGETRPRAVWESEEAAAEEAGAAVGAEGEPIVVELPPSGQRTLTSSDLEASAAGQVQGGVVVQPVPVAPGGGVRVPGGAGIPDMGGVESGIEEDEPPRWIPYQPGLPSTGRLDLELGPAAATAIASRRR